MHELKDKEFEVNDRAELEEFEGRSYEETLLMLTDVPTQQFFKENNFTREQKIQFLKKQHEEIKLERKRIGDELKKKFGIDIRW